MVPIAFLIIPKTIAKRTNDVVEIKKNGAMLMEDIANKRLIDELNCNGSVNESKLISKAGVDWPRSPVEIMMMIGIISCIIVCQLC